MNDEESDYKAEKLKKKKKKNAWYKKLSERETDNLSKNIR